MHCLFNILISFETIIDNEMSISNSLNQFNHHHEQDLAPLDFSINPRVKRIKREFSNKLINESSDHINQENYDTFYNEESIFSANKNQKIEPTDINDDKLELHNLNLAFQTEPCDLTINKVINGQIINKDESYKYTAINSIPEEAENEFTKNQYEIKSLKINNEKQKYKINNFEETNNTQNFVDEYFSDDSENLNQEEVFNFESLKRKRQEENEIKRKEENEIKKEYKLAITELNFTINEKLKHIFNTTYSISILKNPFVNVLDDDIDVNDESDLKTTLFRYDKYSTLNVDGVIAEFKNNFKQHFETVASNAQYLFYLKWLSERFLEIKSIVGENIENRTLLGSKIRFDGFLELINEEKGFYYPRFKNYYDDINEKLIVCYATKVLFNFFKNIYSDKFILRVFPELYIISNLYYLNRGNHMVCDRKWRGCEQIILLITKNIKELNEKYHNRDDIFKCNSFLKEVLAIKSFYILEFFKFLNIKKIYLGLYIKLSINNYELGIKGEYDLVKIYNEVISIFCGTVGENYEKLTFNLKNRL
ncbi:hypothetical protein DMUE_4690 [Dictyocoela muelleri]|nr:hypothetical protein DMUE_4690 [Dictyocoela muelleri]